MVVGDSASLWEEEMKRVLEACSWKSGTSEGEDKGAVLFISGWK